MDNFNFDFGGSRVESNEEHGGGWGESEDWGEAPY